MGKLFKIITVTLALVLAIGIASAVALMFLVNPNDFKQMLSKQVKERTGRDFQIEGNIAWSFFPSIGLTVNKAFLGEPPNFSTTAVGKTNFAEIDKVVLSVKTKPLLDHRIELDTIQLNGLKLNLTQKSATKNNWQGLMKAAAAPSAESTTDAETVEKAPDAGGWQWEYNIKNFGLNDAFVNYQNQQTKQSLIIEDFNLNSTQVGGNKPFPITLNFKFKNNQPNISGKVDGHSEVTINTDQTVYKMNPIDFRLHATGLALNGGALDASIKCNMVLDVAQETFAASNIVATINNQAITGKLQGQKIFSEPRIKGKINTQKINVEGVSVNNVSVGIESHDNLTVLSPITANIYSGRLDGKVVIDHHRSIPVITVDSTLSDIDMQQLLSRGGKSSSIQGKGYLTANVSLQGTNTDTWLRTMAGHLRFAVKGGMVQKIDIMGELNALKSVLAKKAAPSRSGGNSGFASLTGTARIKNGIATSKDIRMDSADYTITGAGSTNLINQKINYDVLVTPKGAIATGILEEIVKSLNGIPFIVTGTISDPMIAPDMAKITVAAAKGIMKQQLEKTLDKSKILDKTPIKTIQDQFKLDKLF